MDMNETVTAPYGNGTEMTPDEGYAKAAGTIPLATNLKLVADMLNTASPVEKPEGTITEAAVAEIAELISASPAEIDFAAIEARMAELGLKAEDFMAPADADSPERAARKAAALAEMYGTGFDQAAKHWEQKAKQPKYLHVSVRVGMDEYGRPTRSAKGATARLKDADPFKPSENLSKRQARKLRKALAAKLRAIQAEDLKFVE